MFCGITIAMNFAMKFKLRKVTWASIAQHIGSRRS